jgi:hypothetical protein
MLEKIETQFKQYVAPLKLFPLSPRHITYQNSSFNFRLVSRSYLFSLSKTRRTFIVLHIYFLSLFLRAFTISLSTRQQQALRQAILSSKQTIDREAKSERELLLKGSMSAIELSEIRRRGAARGSESEYMLNTSKEHNESLSRTLKLMQQEVERTAHSAKVIGNRYFPSQCLALSMKIASLNAR